MKFNNDSSVGENYRLPSNHDTVYDYSPAGNNGTTHNNIIYDPSSRHDGAFEFDGSDDYIDLPKDDMTAGQSEVTLEFWINPDEWVSSNTIWDEYYSNNHWQFSIRCDKWYTRDSSTGTTGSRNNDLSLPSVPVGEWHHLAFVYSVSQSKKAIYLDGKFNTSTSNSIDTLTSDREGARIGYACDGAYFNGTIDEVHVYNRSLSEDEIWQNYITSNKSNGICYCTTCSDCEAKINDPYCSEIRLADNIINHGGTCINNPANFNNKIFDCQEHTIDGGGIE